jgi:hypothetical protein
VAKRKTQTATAMANDVTVKFGVDGKPMEAGLKRAQGQVEAFSKRAQSTVGAMAKRMGGMLAAGLSIRALKSTMDEFDRIGKLATRLDTTTDAIQRLDIASELSGTNLEVTAKSLTTLMRQLESPSNKAAIEAMQKLNIDPRQMRTADSWQQLRMLQDAFQKAQQSGTGLGSVYALLGKNANELLPLLKMSREEFDRISSIKLIEEKEIRKIEALNDRFTELSKTIKVGLMQGVLSLVDGFKQVAEMTEKALHYEERYNEERKRGATHEQADAAAKQQIEEMRAVEKAQEEAEKAAKSNLQYDAEAAQMAQQEMESKQAYLDKLADEARLLEAKASNNEAIIAQVERELAIKAKAAEIEKAGVADREEALKLATKIRDLEEQANKKGDVAATKRKPRAAGFGGLDEFYAMQMAKEFDIGVGQRGKFRAGEQLKEVAEFGDGRITDFGGRNFGRGDIEARLGMRTVQPADAKPEVPAELSQMVDLLKRSTVAIEALEAE